MATLAGKAVGGQRTFTFSTGGPAIQSSVPSDEATISEDQAFVLALDAQPTDESVLAHVSFSAAPIPERIGVHILTGETREAILKTLYGWSRREHVIVLQARQRFPSGSNVRLSWGKGMTSASGVANERDQILSFKVRGPFMAEFHCERENRQAGCLPFTPMTLRFSARIAWEQAQQVALVSSHDQRWNPQVEGTESQEPFVTSVVFHGPFPEAASFQLDIPESLTDEAGRVLANADKFPLPVKTGESPPLAKFAARFGIVEWKADPALPVTLRNLEPQVQTRLLQVETAGDAAQTAPSPDAAEPVMGKRWRLPPEQVGEILAWLRKVAVASRDASVLGDGEPGSSSKHFLLPKPHGAKPFEVVGIPLDTPGLYIVELASPRLGASLLEKSQPLYVPTAVLVTNLSVHVKWGREASLIWVTTLNEGLPVPKAHVAVHNCQGTILWSGRTDEQGVARVSSLPTPDDLAQCPYNGNLFHFDYKQTMAINRLDGGLFATAQTPDDFSFVHSSWDRGIEPWRFQLPLTSEHHIFVAHTIFDRSLFRAGDTVHMKHILREQALRGFSLVPDDKSPNRISIRHLGSDEKYEFPLRWDATGVAESAWTIPKGAKLGRYHVVLVRQSGQPGVATPESAPGEQEWMAGEFRVEEFRVPLMKGILQPPRDPQIGVSELPVEIGVQYLSGGGAAKLPVTLRAQISPKSVVAPADFEGFAFSNELVKEGIVRRGGGSALEPEEEDGDAAASMFTPGQNAVHQRLELALDATGMARATISRLPPANVPLDLLLELEYWDPNGEVQTVSTTVPLWAATWLVGIKANSWAASPATLMAQVAVVDVLGRPVANAPLQVDIFERKFYSHRKRLVGGFYAYEHVEETRRVGEWCRGVTNAQGVLVCDGKPPVEGNLVLQASVADESGRVAVAHQEVWVRGAQDWWFDVQDSDRIDLLPEKRRYEPGEKARLQVRMPFREATALVTAEREGVLEAFVVPLSGKEPVIELPVHEAYAPNMFISVLAVRGRVGGVQPTAVVDLGKPAFKLGVAEIRVGWRAHELRVKVAADRATYRVRDKAMVRVAVRTADGQFPPMDSEVALAAVDEGLLELLPNKSWDLLEAMMGRRGYGVQTATAHMQVVGKRHYGLKALRQGGGGGRQVTRELFDTLLLWRGRVPLDANGEASVAIPLNDSLTSFRIVAVATGGMQLFGTGSTTIRSSQELMILSGIPPLVREGDRFRSELTLRNTTDHAMDLLANVHVDGLPEVLAPQPLSLPPGESKVVGWDITAPPGVQALRYEVEAAETSGVADRLRVAQQVLPAVPVRTFQATLAQWQQEMQQLIERPADALPDQGGVQVIVRPSLADGLDGPREWMRRYPYTCLEQQVSRAVALRDEGLWQALAAALPAHQDADGLLKYFPSMAQGSEVLTAYILSIIHEAGWTIPSGVQEGMLQGLQKFIAGALLRRAPFPSVDLSLRKLAALEALSRYTKLAPPLVGSVTIEPNLWPTSALLDWWSVLHRVPGIAQRAARLREVEQIVRARLNQQGTTMGFSTENSDGLWWLMRSVDENAVRLILLLLEAGQWQQDLPRLLRGALAQQRRGAWDLTVANAWGTLAVEKFARAFEKTGVAGITTASLANTAQKVEWAEMPKGKAFAFPWPSQGTALAVDHMGAGHPWVTMLARAAIPLQAPLWSGYRLTKTLTPIDASAVGRFSRGDLVRVRLTVEAERDMTWVVVNDPIPAGASHVGSGLARDSQLATQGEERKGRVWPAFEERALDAYRAYYEFVPKGTFVVEYTIRLNQSGRFHLPPTRVEALYAPETFAELPNGVVEVQP
jgi:uncharacterized protein YfaS (alpha-2-macroglobulin family)